MGLNELLATADAVFTTVAIVCLVAAYRAIKGTPRRIGVHRNWMLGAVAASALFLGGFVWRFVEFGPTKFQGTALPFKVLFYAVYFTHEPLAVVNVFLAIPALIFGLLNRVKMHREIAPMAYWIWMYAAASGVVIYVLLYLWPRLTGLAPA